MSGLVYSDPLQTRRISNRNSNLRTNGKDVVLGPDGVFRLIGNSTVWDEVSQPFIGKNILVSVGRVDYNFTELTLDFTATARYPEDPVGVVLQTPHARKLGSDIRPHIHWIQTSDATPNILVEYRFCNNGDVPTAWVKKALLPDDNAFAYAEGIQQITNFNLPAGHGTSLGLSGTFECKLYRDSSNASGLFPGVDTYTGSWSTKYYDIHIEMDTLGSAGEFTK